MNPATVLFRADASLQMGTGHVMRCLAVAEALADEGHEPIFALAETTAAIDARLDADGFARCHLPVAFGSRQDCRATLALAATLNVGAIMLDGYHFDTAYRAALRAGGLPVGVFDDLADADALHADLVVNAAPQAGQLPYDRIAPGAVRLLGPSYAPLRREIRDAIARPSQPVEFRDSILISFGGSDPLGLTEPVLGALAKRLPDTVRIVAIVGGSNPRAESMKSAASAFGARIELHVDTQHMGALMSEAGLAVSAAGTTTAELAALAVPTLLVVVADNQAVSAAELQDRGLCETMTATGPETAESIAERTTALWKAPDRRLAMAVRMKNALDGGGAPRIAAQLVALIESARTSSPYNRR